MEQEHKLYLCIVFWEKPRAACWLPNPTSFYSSGLTQGTFWNIWGMLRLSPWILDFFRFFFDENSCLFAALRNNRFSWNCQHVSGMKKRNNLEHFRGVPVIYWIFFPFFVCLCVLFCFVFDRKIPTTALPMKHMDTLAWPEKYARLHVSILPFVKKQLCHNYLFRFCFDPKYHRVGSSKSMTNYDFRQWETTLHCNAISHWLSPYQEWSLIQYGFCRNQELDQDHSAARRLIIKSPDSKVYGANMGPVWGRQDPGGPHVGPMNLAIWVWKPQEVGYLPGSASLGNLKRNPFRLFTVVS